MSCSGTPSHLSPELLQGGKADSRADMWAVGVILYEILAGRRPFQAPTITGLITKIMTEPPPPFDVKALQMPDGLAAAALRALDKKPERRFADLDEMAKALLLSMVRTRPRDAARPARQETGLRGQLRRGAAPAGRRRPVARPQRTSNRT